MSAQHTPGPWKWLGENLEGPNYTDVIASRVACGQWCQGGSCELAISDADKALIEAAPELLAALIEMEREKSDYMTRNKLGDPAVEHTNKAARAAIAKATGAQA